MNRKWWIAVIAIILFGVESIFAFIFPASLFPDDWIFVPRFLFVFFLMVTVYYDEKAGLLCAFLFGFFMDLVFTQILGIYLFWYPAIAWLVARLMKVIHNHLLIMNFICLLAISALEFGVYFFNKVLQITSMDVATFAENRLVTVLALNFVFFVLFSYPLKKYLTEIYLEKQEEEGMFQSD